MTIVLSKENYDFNRSQITECVNGEMCKIVRIVDAGTGKTSYYICADVTGGGWTTRDGRRFHGHEICEDCTRTGLGTFHLIQKMETSDGGCVLEFTDDLNPDLP